MEIGCEADDAGRAGSRAARDRRGALSPAASVSRAPARRQMHQGPGAGLGAQSLLLPGDDPDQGREPDRALRRFGVRRDWRSRLVDHDGEARRRRRHRPLAQAHRRPRARPRLRHVAARACCPARASPSRPMCISCARRRCSKRSPRRSPSCSRRSSSASGVGHAQGYPFVTRETLAYFDKRPPQAQRDSDFALDYVKRHARTPDEQHAGARRARIQVRRAVVDARRAALCLCVARAHSAGRLRAAGDER